MSVKVRLATTVLLATTLAGLGMVPASAAPGEPIGVSDADAEWLAAQGVDVSINSAAISLSGTGAAPTVVVWGAGVITEQDKFAGPAAGSIIPAHDDYAWAHEIGAWGSLNLNADAHTSYRVGGAGGEDYTRIADRMNTLVANDVYAGRDGIGHEASTLSDCTVSECGVWVSPVVLEQHTNGDDVLRTTADARWIEVQQDGSAWENSAGIAWDASAGRGTRVQDGFLSAYRAQSTGTLSAPWLPAVRPALPAPATSTVNPDGTVSVGVSGGGVAARRGLVMLNLGYGGGEVIDPGTPAEPPAEPPVVTPEPTTPEVTPSPEPTVAPAPEVTAPPVLRFETGEFAPSTNVSPASGHSAAQWMLLAVLGVASLALAGGFVLIARDSEAGRARTGLLVSATGVGVGGIALALVLGLQDAAVSPATAVVEAPVAVEKTAAPEPIASPTAAPTAVPEPTSERSETPAESAPADRLVIESVGLDVPLKVETIPASGTINPASFDDAWEETSGGFYPGQEGDGTLLVAMHASNVHMDAPGNAVSDGQSVAVSKGDVVQVRDEQFTVTATYIIPKSQWSGLAEGWESVEGRLLLVTCLPPADGSGHAESNVVIVGEPA